MLWLIPIAVLSYLMVGICVIRIIFRANGLSVKSVPGEAVGAGVLLWPMVLIGNLFIWFLAGVGRLAKGS